MSYDTIKSGNERRAREWANASGGTHECAVEGCGEIISTQLLMCAEHWHRVPAPMQRAVWQTWKALRHGGSCEAYEAAREAAIRSVNGGQL